jgi:hypothetical protein
MRRRRTWQPSLSRSLPCENRCLRSGKGAPRPPAPVSKRDRVASVPWLAGSCSGKLSSQPVLSSPPPTIRAISNQVRAGSYTSYTPVVKTAVSIPDQLFADAESAARRLGVSRSRLYARALEQFLAQQETDPVTARLDELADEFEPGSGVADGRRLIDQGLWQW